MNTEILDRMRAEAEEKLRQEAGYAESVGNTIGGRRQNVSKGGIIFQMILSIALAAGILQTAWYFSGWLWYDRYYGRGHSILTTLVMGLTALLLLTVLIRYILQMTFFRSIFAAQKRVEKTAQHIRTAQSGLDQMYGMIRDGSTSGWNLKIRELKDRDETLKAAEETVVRKGDLQTKGINRAVTTAAVLYTAGWGLFAASASIMYVQNLIYRVLTWFDGMFSSANLMEYRSFIMIGGAIVGVILLFWGLWLINMFTGGVTSWHAFLLALLGPAAAWAGQAVGVIVGMLIVLVLFLLGIAIGLAIVGVILYIVFRMFG